MLFQNEGFDIRSMCLIPYLVRVNLKKNMINNQQAVHISRGARLSVKRRSVTVLE